MDRVAVAVWLECFYKAYERDMHTLHELYHDIGREEFAINYQSLFPSAIGFGLPLARFVG